MFKKNLLNKCHKIHTNVLKFMGKRMKAKTLTKTFERTSSKSFQK